MYRSSPFRSTLNRDYITGLDMCKVCTEAVYLNRVFFCECCMAQRRSLSWRSPFCQRKLSEESQIHWKSVSLKATNTKLQKAQKTPTTMQSSGECRDSHPSPPPSVSLSSCLLGRLLLPYILRFVGITTLLDPALSAAVAALGLYLREGNPLEDLLHQLGNHGRCSNGRQRAVVQDLINMWHPYVLFEEIFSALTTRASTPAQIIANLKKVIISGMVREAKSTP